MTDSRLLIEAELTAEELAGLRSLCALFRIHESRWREVKALQQTYETAAVIRMSARLYSKGRISKDRAVMEAAATLEVNYNTARTRVNNWYRPACLIFNRAA